MDTWKIRNQRIIDESDFDVTPGYKVQTGLFRSGKRRNWLYSKKLFPDPGYLRVELLETPKSAAEVRHSASDENERGILLSDKAKGFWQKIKARAKPLSI
ncbi:MAG: hypothetical protein ABJI96_04335 [Paracoccaceae bacterium]